MKHKEQRKRLKLVALNTNYQIITRPCKAITFSHCLGTFKIMRTAIFLGLIFIAKAICLEVVTNRKEVLAIFILVMIVMDLAEFIKRMLK